MRWTSGPTKMGASIYLILDVINDLMEGAYAEEARLREVVSNTRLALDKARAAELLIGFVRVGFSPDYRECSKVSPVFSRLPAIGTLKLGSHGTEVVEALKPAAREFDIVKHRVSPFFGTNLEVVLRTHSVTRIYCSGISTNAVVQSTVREGHDRDYEMVVLEDCCSALTAREHACAIEDLRRFASFTTATYVQFERAVDPSTAR